MEFTVEFYEQWEAGSPVRRVTCWNSKPVIPTTLQPWRPGLEKLRHRQCHREPLTRALNGGLFELRHVGKLNTRVLWFFVKGRRIIAVHGIRNKGQAIPGRDLDTARERMRDWKERK